ncbi:MAG: cell division protein FtsZ, partial [Myxococcales bacterium]
AKSMGCLTVGVVTKPFIFEGNRRRKQAEQGLVELKAAVDTLITIPNQRLLALGDEKLQLLDAFRRADEVLLNAVQGISDLIQYNGYINVDFADARTIMQDKGIALMGTGIGSGDRRAVEAMQQAIASPLLEDVSIDGATGLLINITAPRDIGLQEIHEAISLVQEAADPEAEIIFGSLINDDATAQTVKITIIATGFAPKEQKRGMSLPSAMPAARPAVQQQELKVLAPVKTARPPVLDKNVSRPPTTAAQLEPTVPMPGSSPNGDDDQWDIPTFLRRQQSGEHG